MEENEPTNEETPPLVLLGQGDMLLISPDENFALYDTRCTTPRCANEPFIIRVSAAATDPRVTCGVCSLPIQDIEIFIPSPDDDEPLPEEA